MMTPGLMALIDKNEAVVKTFTGTGGVFIIDNDDKTAIIITHIKVHAFADLPVGMTFDATQVALNNQNFNHMLQVNGQKNADSFMIRHKVKNIQDPATGVSYVVPDGDTDFDVFLKHTGPVVFQLVHAPLATAWSQVYNQVNPKYPVPPPLYGYGTAPTGFSVLSNFTIPIRSFGVKPPGKLAADNPPGLANNGVSMRYPFLAQTVLNQPSLAIDFAQYTIPLVDITYVQVNKQVDSTF